MERHHFNYITHMTKEKIPSYGYFTSLWKKIINGIAWDIGNYTCYEVTDEMSKKLLLILLQDSMGEEGLIPIAYLEDEYQEFTFNLLEYFDLSRTQFKLVDSGFVNHVISIPLKTNRFRRYYNLVTEAWILKEWVEAEPHIRSLEKVQEEYWRSKKIEPYTFKLMIHYVKDLFNKERAFGILLKQEEYKGIGIFSYKENELYWEISFKDNINHLGNNILCAAEIYCQTQNIKYLNLGVERASSPNWKSQWHTKKVPCKGIRPENTLEEAIQHLKDNFEVKEFHITNSKDSRGVHAN